MPVQLDKPDVAIDPAGGTLRRFYTDLPDVGASITAAGNAVGTALENYGERRWIADAEKSARDTANSTPVQKNPDGTWTRSMTPDSFGPGAAAMYDKIYDERFTNAIVLDTQDALDRIQTENLDNPQAAHGKMQSYVEGVLGKLDPKYAGQVQNPLAREVEERSRGVLWQVAQRDRQASVQELQRQQVDFVDIAQRKYAGGDEAGGDEAIAKARKAQELLVQHHEEVPGSEHFEDTMRQAKASGVFMGAVQKQIDNGDISPKDLETLESIINGTAPEGTKVLGIDRKWVDENMADEKVRGGVRVWINRLKSDMGQHWAEIKKEVDYDRDIEPYDKGFRGHMSGPNASDREEMLARQWAEKNGKNLSTPDGVGAVLQKFGWVPDGLVKPMFKDGAFLNAENLKPRLDIYNQLKHSQAVQNGPEVDLTGAIPAEDRAFWEHYSMSIAAGNDPVTSQRAAIAAVKNKVEVNNPESFLLQRFREADKNPQAGVRDMADAMLKDLPVPLHQLPPDARQAVLNDAAQQVAMGVPLDQAMRGAVSSFRHSWVQDPAVRNGWVPKRFAISPTLDKDGRMTTSYVGRAVEQLKGHETDKKIVTNPETGETTEVDEPDTTKSPAALLGARPGDALPKDFAYGKTVFSVPRPNGQISFVYRSPNDPQRDIAVVDRKTGAPIVIDGARLAQDVDARQKDQNLQHAKERRDFEIKQKQELEAGNKAVESGQSIPTPTAKDPGRNKDAEFDVERYRVVTDMEDPDSVSRRRSDAKKGGSGGSGGRGWKIPEKNDDGSERLPDTGTSGQRPKGVKASVDWEDVDPQVRGFGQRLVSQFDIDISSGYRAWSKRTGTNSQHARGLAIDISTYRMSEVDKGRLLDTILDDPRVNGVGYYNRKDGMIHVDFRQRNASGIAGGHDAWGPNYSHTSLDLTPPWFNRRVSPWLDGKRRGQRTSWVDDDAGDPNA